MKYNYFFTIFIIFIIILITYKIYSLRNSFVEHYNPCSFYNTCKWFHSPYKSSILDIPVFTQPMFTDNLIARDIGLNLAK